MLSKVGDSRGAPMGRPERNKAPSGAKFQLIRIRINSGGYDSGGAYWGIGTPLYWATTEDGATEFFFRAVDRDAAKAEVGRRHPGARFFR